MSIAILMASLGSPLLWSAPFSPNWTGNGDGTSWEDAANWDSTAYPNNGSGDFYHPYIENGISNLSIQTQSNLTTTGLTLTQVSGGSTTLKLGGDLILSEGGLATGSGIFNTTGTAAGVTIDLNGYTFSSSSLSLSRHNFHNASYTVGSSHSNGTGTYNVRNIHGDANIIFNDNITVRLTTVASSTLSNATWGSGTTLQIASLGNHNAVAGTTVTLGNLTLGDTANTSASVFGTGNNSTITVSGDLTILTFTGATEGAASRISFSNSGSTLRVGGNFTDHGSDTDFYGGNTSIEGTLAFVGGAASEKVVTIGRQGLRNHFHIGDSESAGNIALGNHLSTIRNIRVQGDSRINLNEYSLNAGDTLEIEAGAQLALQEGGVFNAETLILDSFHLELLGDWDSWSNGDDLLLFTYTNLSDTSTPTLSSISGPYGLTHSGLVVDNGNIWLSNVAIPEPHAMLIFGIAIGLIVSVQRFRKLRP